MYKYGREEAENQLGLGQGLAIGAAGAAPFAGLIGQKPLIHDPYANDLGASSKSLHALQRQALPGDVIVSSKPGWGMFKTPQEAITGSPLYHAEPVVRKGGRVAPVNSFNDPSYKDYNAKELLKETDKMTQSGYPDVVLLRPKKLSGNQPKMVAEHAVMRAKRDYDEGQAVKNTLKDIFVPKIKGVTDLGQSAVCEGNICSTTPSQAMEDVGKGLGSIVPGKRAKDIMPADYLRSPDFEHITHFVNKNRYSGVPPIARKALPYLTRAGLGATMAGGTAALTEKPELGGAAAGALGAQALLPYALKDAPTLGYVGKTMLDEASSQASKAKTYGRFGKMTLPAMLAGGALGYGGAHLLRKAISDKSK